MKNKKILLLKKIFMLKSKKFKLNSIFKTKIFISEIIEKKAIIQILYIYPKVYKEIFRFNLI